MRCSLGPALAALLVVACGSSAKVRPFDGQAAYRAVETQVAFGPRIPGTPGHAARH